MLATWGGGVGGAASSNNLFLQKKLSLNSDENIMGNFKCVGEGQYVSSTAHGLGVSQEEDL